MLLWRKKMLAGFVLTRFVLQRVWLKLLKLAGTRQAHNYRGKHNHFGWNSCWRSHTGPCLHLLINYIQFMHFHCVLYKHFSLSLWMCDETDLHGTHKEMTVRT